ncbi:hypothetical protein Q3H58_003560 [Pseudomonas psychrotolerans]|nr:hypothetical protein [Pseudomonas psychrotolerans]
MDKKKADQQASPKHSAVDSTSGAAQRQRLLERLQEGPANTVELRRDLNINDARRPSERAARGWP